MLIDEEAELVRRAQAGDETAFLELVHLYRDRTWAVCLRITGSPADAEDALQDALTAAWLHLGRFRGESRFGTWLHRIASNAALAVLRRRRETGFAVEDYDDVLVVDDATERSANRLSLVGVLMNMSEEFRTVLVLREIGDLTYEEIAQHQGVSVQTVKSRLNRARAKLAQQWQADY